MSGGKLHDDFTQEPIPEVPGQSCSGESVTNFSPAFHAHGATLAHLLSERCRPFWGIRERPLRGHVPATISTSHTVFYVPIYWMDEMESIWHDRQPKEANMSTTQPITLFHSPQTRSSGALALLEELKAPYKLHALNMKAGEQRQSAYLS